MTLTASAQTNLNTELYPFQHHYIQLDSGAMHYIDDGEGDVLLFVHGTPTWSFLYRDFIKAFSKNYRCIAIDHLGFGLSEKSLDFDGTPESHSKNLSAFIQKLGLENITLVVHDFGGPIGLASAIENPSKIKQVVLLNTWLWETKSNPSVQKLDGFLNSGLGNFLYLRMNFSPKVLLKKGFYNKRNLTKIIHKQYLFPFPKKETRYELLRLAKSLYASSDWYQKQWEQLSAISDKPWLILWGTKDEFITPEYLEKWKTRLPNAQVETYEVGHFVQEEKGIEAIERMKKFLTQKQAQIATN